MKQVRGSQLPYRLQREVLNAYGYRWTVENMPRARQWYGSLGKPTINPISDSDWLACTDFFVTRKGELSLKHRYCITHR
jgi:hypothetical protein